MNLLPEGTLCTITGASDAGRLVVVVRYAGVFPEVATREGYFVRTYDRLPFTSVRVITEDGKSKLHANPPNVCVADRVNLEPVAIH